MARLDGILKDPVINTIAYALAAGGTVWAQHVGWHSLEHVCKPLMMLVLSSWFFFASRRVGDRFTLLVQAGLFFSLIGDVALMFQGSDEFNFIIGLAAFLIAHVCYLLAFAQNIIDADGGEGVILPTSLTAVVVLYGALFIIELVGSAGVEETLKVPVVAYAIAISLMAIAAAWRYRRTYDLSFWLVFAGAAFFIVSDSLLAIAAAWRYRRTYDLSFWLVFAGAAFFIVSDSLLANRKFNLRPLEVGAGWVTLSYAAAQFLIAAGCLMHVLDPDMIRKRQALTT